MKKIAKKAIKAVIVAKVVHTITAKVLRSLARKTGASGLNRV